MGNQYLEIPLLTYSLARSAIYFTEFSIMNQIVGRLVRHYPHLGYKDPAKRSLLLKELVLLLKNDTSLFVEGILPVSTLVPEELPKAHMRRMVKVCWDGLGLYKRRSKGQTARFKKSIKPLLNHLPRYFQRNFHFQTDGYLSDESAQMYDHQVEMLFFGTADPMRRLIIRPLKDSLSSTQKRPLRILEIAAGAGSTTRFLRAAFPDADITAIDLSEFYVNYARVRFEGDSKINFMVSNASELPFKSNYYDAVVSIFLFHELPRNERKKVVSECVRVLKPGGFLGFVDSIQHDDCSHFNDVLEEFPKNYHEPFFRDYANDPMKKWLQKHSFQKINSSIGFLSKAVWGNKATK